MDKFVGSSRENFFYHNTLLCLVKTLQGRSITLDLRNDSCVCGKIISVDGFMNISFINAVYCDPQGNEFQFDNLFVQGRNIRYVHVPETVSILAALKNELSKQKKPESIKKTTAQSRKVKKALKLHMETVASLQIKG